MFGLSWGQIAIIVLVGVFVLGPERIPTAVTWVLTMLRKARTMAAGAQAELRREIGPEIEELRRQVADLQSLKEIQELRNLRDLHPKRLIGKNILGDEFSGGITGFLGLNQPAPGSSDTSDPGGELNGAIPNGAATTAATTQNGSANPAVGTDPATVGATATIVPPHRPASMTKLAAPNVVGSTGANTTRRPVPASLNAGERPPFDLDGT